MYYPISAGSATREVEKRGETRNSDEKQRCASTSCPSGAHRQASGAYQSASHYVPRTVQIKGCKNFTYR